MIDLHKQPERLVITLEVPHPAKVVWVTLTEAPHVARWWGEYVALEAVAGGRFLERWRDGAGRPVETAGTVTRCEPPSCLEMTWADDGWPVATRVSFRLEPTPDGTRLTLEHAGWDRFPGDEGASLLDQHAAGWEHHMRSFSAYLAR